MVNSIKKPLGRFVHGVANLFHKQTLAFLLAICCFAFAYADDSKVFIQSTHGIKGFGGLVTKKNGELLLSGQPRNIRIFDPGEQEFEGNAYVLTDFSFSDDLVIIPRDDSRGIIGGFSIASFLDGRIPTVLNDETVIQSNQGQFIVVPETGIYQASFNPQLIGIDPITYRSSNDRLYAQSALDPTTLYVVDWRGSVPSPIFLNPPTALNAFQFGPDDKLYAPDVGNNQIVRIDADTGDVTPIVPNILVPIALKVDSHGILYFIGRTTGNVYKYNPTSNVLTLLATVEPALDNLTISKEEDKLYVTNDENRIVQVDVNTGATNILFDSPIVQPWDLAFDPDTNSLYVADLGSLKQYNSRSAQRERYLILDDVNSGLAGSGSVSGITVEQGPDAKIVITDITIGNLFVINKSDFSLYDFIDGFSSGLFSKQPFSAVRITGGSPSEYYLVVNAVDGTILKIFHTAGGLAIETFFSGLNSPVKVKHYNGYLYVVEAGQLTQGIPNTGRVSRISIATQIREVLLDNLNNPQGLDIVDDKLVVLEVGSGRLLQGSASGPGAAIVLKEGLQFSNDLLISSFNPIPIDPFAGVAADPNGKRIFINQTEPDNILLFKHNKPL